MSQFLVVQGQTAMAQLADQIGVQAQALGALHNRLRRIVRFRFLEEDARNDAAKEILDHLEAGKHVVLEFGRYGNDLTAYILLSNLLSRRIHDRYVELKERAMAARAKTPVRWS